MTDIWPLIFTSFNGRSPSGVTKSISNWLFRAMIKFKSVGDVKLPEKYKVFIINLRQKEMCCCFQNTPVSHHCTKCMASK